MKTIIFATALFSLTALEQTTSAPSDTQSAATTAPTGATDSTPPVSHDDPLWTLAFPTPKEITLPKIVKGTCTNRMLSGKFDPSKIGATLVEYHVMPDGSVLGVKIDQSSGVDALDETVSECVKQWQYTPAMYNGTPVEVTRKMNIDWKKRF